MRRMRWLMCALIVVGSAQGAAAGDLGLPILRGSTTYDVGGPTRWDGFYVGAQAGGTWSGTDFANSTKSLVAFILRNTTIESEQHVSDWTTLGKSDTSGNSWGGFIGYQMQWDEVVFGAEANYSRTNMSTSASDAMRRTFSTSDGYSNDVQVTATSAIHITDYGTARFRAGWAAGNFLPYAFVGVAIGRADVSRSARVIASGFDTTGSGNPPYSSDITNAAVKNGAFAYGWTSGLGLEMALMQRFFVRGEYEYVQFGAFNDLNTHIHTARAAVGVKF
jgi:outer membrane immunogenic protein